MKSFNKDNYNRCLRDFRSLDKSIFKNEFYTWVIDIAVGFPTDQMLVGILDKNDIIQECFLAFEIAWSNLNWDAIHGLPESEQKAMIWAFIKKSVKLKVKNRLLYFKDGVRTHSVDGVNLWKNKNVHLEKTVDNFLSILFTDFHTRFHQVWEEEVSLWDVEKLANGLDIAMREFLSDHDRMVLEMYYGIDCKKLTLKQIAVKMNKTQNAITVQKMRNLKKLNNERVKQIIRENFC